MPLTSVLFIFSIALILRIYIMKFMSKKQPTGVIYFKWSYPLLFATYMVTYFLAFSEYFWQSMRFPVQLNIVGGIIMFSGAAVTMSTIKAVGISWSLHIEIKAQHQLCEKGLYRYMRNPYYFGVFFELLGACLLYNGVYALWFLMLVHMPLVVWRAYLEERISLKEIKGYRHYKTRVRNFL